MDIGLLKDLLHKVKDGTIEVDEAITRLKSLPFEDIGFASIDHHRSLRRGFPEVIYGQVAETITRVGKVGAMPYLSEYSPLPHTEMWKEAVAVSRFDLTSEPLFHNNSIFPCWNGEALEKVSALKNMAHEIRERERRR
jgi:NCAIR mutase (PurE)-related proteins